MTRSGVCIVLRGPLGVGKTTVARALAKELHARVISIDDILEREGLEQWEDGYISEAAFVRANAFAANEAAPTLRKGAPVIVDGNFYHRGAIEDLLARLGTPHLVVTLVAPLATCVQRDRAREGSLGAAATRDVFRKVAEVRYGIEVDARPPVEQIVGKILEQVRSNADPRSVE